MSNKHDNIRLKKINTKPSLNMQNSNNHNLNSSLSKGKFIHN